MFHSRRPLFPSRLRQWWRSSLDRHRTLPMNTKSTAIRITAFLSTIPRKISPKNFMTADMHLPSYSKVAAGEPGFQISVAPINGTKITPERFNMDEPSGIKLEPHDTVIDGASGIAFFGFDARVGQTREIWFIHNHFLFEVMTYTRLRRH